MKIAIISDIHGNTLALDAVLKDIENEKCDKVFCLGDIAMAGAEPDKTIDTIQSLQGENFLVIQGNTDEMIANFDKIPPVTFLDDSYPMINALKSDMDIISDSQVHFLKNLDKQKEIELNGLKILLVHGSPRKNNEDISPDLPLEKVEEIIKDTDADIIFCGHTHLPCGYQTNTKQTVVNAGSVGRSLIPNAQSCYAILTIHNDKSFEIEHKFIKYDNIKASELLKSRGYKGADKIASLLIHPTSRHG